MKNKKLIGAKIFGYSFLIFGILYTIYAFWGIISAFTSDCGLGGFFCFWGGFPFLIVGLYKVKLGKAFLQGNAKNLKAMLILVGILNIMIVYFLFPWVNKIAFSAFWLFFYILAIIYLTMKGIKLTGRFQNQSQACT